MISTRLELAKIEDLIEHEEVDEEHLKKISRLIAADGVLKRPLAVDYRTRIVLDGVHRLNFLKRCEFECEKVPVYSMDFLSDQIVVFSADHTKLMHKDDVIEAALSGKKLPPRTTWHMIRMANGHLEHISVIEKEAHYPLVSLAMNR